MSFVRKTIMASLFIVLSFTALGTITFAWLSVATVNAVDVMELGALADGLELSLTGEPTTFRKELNINDFIDTLVSLKMRDVTSVDNKAFKTLQGGPATVNVDYLTFVVYIRTSTIHDKVFLVENNLNATFDDFLPGTAVASKGIDFYAPFDFQYKPDVIVRNGELRRYYASNAIRLGFAEQLVDVGDYDDTRDNESLHNKIFDPSGDEIMGFGKEYGQHDFFNIMHTDPTKQISLPTVFPNTLYDFTKFSSNPNIAEDDKSLIVNLVETDLIDNSTGNPFKYGKVKINIWLEGYDADAFDSVYYDILKVRLKLKSGLIITD